MKARQKLEQLMNDFADYVQYAKEALEKNDMDEVESNLFMLCEDAGTALQIAEDLNNG